MSNIEEDIKKLKSYLKDSSYKENGTDFFKSGGWEIVDLEIPLALEHLLSDYTRQRQINEQHQKINGELREKVKELESDLYSTNCIVKELTEENIKLKVLEDDIKDKRITYIDTPEFEENYIPKQKIKDKIKELSNTKGDFATYIAVSERIKVLEELLQESEGK